MLIHSRDQHHQRNQQIVLNPAHVTLGWSQIYVC